jgi:hypothetical protein
LIIGCVGQSTFDANLHTFLTSVLACNGTTKGRPRLTGNDGLASLCCGIVEVAVGERSAYAAIFPRLENTLSTEDSFPAAARSCDGTGFPAKLNSMGRIVSLPVAHTMPLERKYRAKPSTLMDHLGNVYIQWRARSMHASQRLRMAGLTPAD